MPRRRIAVILAVLTAALAKAAAAGEIGLAEAQREIAADWIAAYKKYVKKQR